MPHVKAAAGQMMVQLDNGVTVTPKSSVNVDVTLPLAAAALAVGKIVQIDSAAPPTPSPSASSGSSTWLTPSPLGVGSRRAADILMSAYDTNPSSSDQTAAFVAAFAAALAIIETGIWKVRILLDSRQKYSIGGAVTAGPNGEWTQIALPYAPKSVARGMVQIVGMPRGPNDFSDYTSHGESGTVIESTLNSAPAFQATRGIASIFGSTSSFNTNHTAGGTAMNAIGFATQDITIRSASPVICGIDCGFCDAFQFDGLLQFDTDTMAGGGTLVVCTAPQAIPCVFPFVGAARGTSGDTLVVAGWMCGPQLGELATVRKILTFCHAGCSLSLDEGTQYTHIGDLIEWNAAFGIAQISPTYNGAPGSPQMPTPASNRNPGSGLVLATPLKIDNWTVQTTGSASGIPVSTNRVNDVLDTGGFTAIDCPCFNSTTDALARVLLSIVGSGAAPGLAARCRILDGNSRSFGGAQGVPASATPMRNPYARDALVNIAGGAVSAVSVNGVAQAVISPVLVPANGLIQLTYTTPPTTFFWQPL